MADQSRAVHHSKRLLRIDHESRTSARRSSISIWLVPAMISLAARVRKAIVQKNRYIVFQALTHTVDGLNPVAVRIFAKSHDETQSSEYAAAPRLTSVFLEN